MSAALQTEIEDGLLQAYFVWLPVLAADDLAAAERTASRIELTRARHYWDHDLRLSHHIADALGIERTLAPDGRQTSGIAWDVYLLYQPGKADLERPTFWMHQLDVISAPRLDANALAAQARKLLEH